MMTFPANGMAMSSSVAHPLLAMGFYALLSYVVNIHFNIDKHALMEIWEISKIIDF